MNMYRSLCFLLLLAVVVITACDNSAVKNKSGVLPDGEPVAPNESPDRNGLAEVDPQHPSKQPNPAYDEISQYISTMSLREKIGQLMIVGFEGTSTDEQAHQLIAQYHVGGVIFYARNIDNANQLLDLINELKAANSAHNSIPLFFSVDEEGGGVSRLPDEYMSFPSSRAIGMKEDPKLAYEVGRGLAMQISSLGLNMNFAPVLDVDSNPHNPVIGDRAFASTPEQVSELGVQTMKGMQEQAVIPVVKHFPGHGDTYVDSHLGLPVVEHDRERLQAVEWLPFVEAIQQEADAVMTAHILFPEVDPHYPATLSEKIISGLLRDEMGFDGVVITDDLTMRAVVEHFEIGEAAVLSIQAGVDIVLVCHEYEQMHAVFEAVEQAVIEGTLDEQRIDESVYRILRLKTKYELEDVSILSVDPAEINRQLQHLF